MIFRQILHPQTGCASYVFGCTGKAKLAVVDPHIEHIEEYLAVAQQANSPIVAIFETHTQADHVSGARALAAVTHATIYLHESVQVKFPFTPLHDSDEVELGNDYVRVLHTPGHSSDSISLVVGDKVRAETQAACERHIHLARLSQLHVCRLGREPEEWHFAKNGSWEL